MRWYITVAAVREFQRIMGWPEVNDGPDFDDAAKWLSELCDAARMQKDEGHRQIWIVKAKTDSGTVRLELYVSTAARKEGPLDQLVRVRKK